MIAKPEIINYQSDRDEVKEQYISLWLRKCFVCRILLENLRLRVKVRNVCMFDVCYIHALFGMYKNSLRNSSAIRNKLTNCKTFYIHKCQLHLICGTANDCAIYILKQIHINQIME